MAGMLAVLVVVWIFMGWRSGIIVATSLPLAAACVLFALQVLDMQIQQMSMFGMIIAIGLLIDNAIVMTDEVRARMKEGLSPVKAVEGALDHLFMPLFVAAYAKCIECTNSNKNKQLFRNIADIVYRSHALHQTIAYSHSKSGFSF